MFVMNLVTVHLNVKSFLNNHADLYYGIRAPSYKQWKPLIVDHVPGQIEHGNS